MATQHKNDPKALLAARRKALRAAGGSSTKRDGLTPRIKKAIELFVIGQDDAGKPILTQQDAADAVGLSTRALRMAMAKPTVATYYTQQCVALREAERAASIRAIAGIRDDEKLKGNAAGQKVRLSASERLAFDQPTTSINVAVGVNVGGQRESPGYVIDLSPFPTEEQQPVRQVIDVTPALAWRELGE